MSRAPCMPTLPPSTLSPASRHAPRPLLHAPLSTPAERGKRVRPQQEGHPLRVGGHRGLRRQCSHRLGHLAFGRKLPRVKIDCTRLCVTAAAIKARKKERVGDERVNQPKHHESGRDHRRRADPTARDSKRLIECWQTGTDCGYRGQVKRGVGQTLLTCNEKLKGIKY